MFIQDNYNALHEQRDCNISCPIIELFNMEHIELKTMSLLFSVPPKMVQGPGEERGVEDHEVSLTCEASGHPAPKYDFYKVSQLVKCHIQTHQSLHFNIFWVASLVHNKSGKSLTLLACVSCTSKVSVKRITITLLNHSLLSKQSLN